MEEVARAWEKAGNRGGSRLAHEHIQLPLRCFRRGGLVAPAVWEA